MRPHETNFSSLMERVMRAEAAERRIADLMQCAVCDGWAKVAEMVPVTAHPDAAPMCPACQRAEAAERNYANVVEETHRWKAAERETAEKLKQAERDLELVRAALTGLVWKEDRALTLTAHDWERARAALDSQQADEPEQDTHPLQRLCMCHYPPHVYLPGKCSPGHRVSPDEPAERPWSTIRQWTENEAGTIVSREKPWKPNPDGLHEYRVQVRPR